MPYWSNKLRKVTNVVQTFFGWVWKEHSCALIQCFEFGISLKRTQNGDLLAYIQKKEWWLYPKLHYLCRSSQRNIKKNLVIKSLLWLIVHKYYPLISTPLSSHFFLAKRLNFFSLSFLAELGSGRAAEEEGAGRVWALAPEDPDASSTARGWTAFSMAWLQRWSSSWN